MNSHMWAPPDIRLTSSLLSPDDWNVGIGPAAMVIRCDSGSLMTTLESPTGIEQQWADPLAALAWMADHFNDPSDRWIGYLGYDVGRLFEELPSQSVDDLGLPLFLFSLHSLSHNAGSKVLRRAGAFRRSDPALRSTSETGIGLEKGHPSSSLPREKYLDRVRKVIDYIRAGDVFQVNLSQRFTAPLIKPIDAIWNDLNEHSPAAFGAFLDYGDHALLCNSPELFLKILPDRRILTRPIKGTRPRMPGMEVELRDSIKDQAELNMIVDLERNDLGRVCEIGSVKVTEPRAIETHPTVYHGVATVEGFLRPDVTFVDLLRATFPGGSITGAPKIRAMHIIDELEPVRRGPYCGAIGYLAADGSMQFNIAIRTMIIKDNQAHMSVGGGIVADSDPDAEYEETLVKAAAMFRALGIMSAER